MRSKVIRVKKKLGLGIFSVLAGISILILAKQQISFTGDTFGLKPDQVPILLCIIMLISGVALIAQSLLGKDESIEIDIANEIRVLLYLVILALYVVVFEKIGFIISTFLMSSALLVIKKCKTWYYYLILLALVIVVFLLFKSALKVNLPWGFPLRLIFE